MKAMHKLILGGALVTLILAYQNQSTVPPQIDLVVDMNVPQIGSSSYFRGTVQTADMGKTERSFESGLERAKGVNANMINMAFDFNSAENEDFFSLSGATLSPSSLDFAARMDQLRTVFPKAADGIPLIVQLNLEVLL